MLPGRGIRVPWVHRSDRVYLKLSTPRCSTRVPCLCSEMVRSSTTTLSLQLDYLVDMLTLTQYDCQPFSLKSDDRDVVIVPCLP